MDIEFSNDVFARIGEDCTKVVNRIAGLEKHQTPYGCCHIDFVKGFTHSDIMIGVELGEDDEQRFDDKGYAVLDYLLDKIPYDHIRERTVEFMDKYDMGEDDSPDVDDFFLDIERHNVLEGQFNPIGLIAENDSINPFATLLYQPYNDEVKLIVGMMDGTGRELLYDVPLTAEERSKLQEVVDDRINTGYFKGLLIKNAGKEME